VGLESYIGLSNEQIERITQLVSQKLLNTPGTWGDPARIAVGKEVFVCNALFN
jgi:hypothetical protein